MEQLKNMPAVGVIVIFVILVLFTVSVLLLIHVCSRYRYLIHKTGTCSVESSPSFIRYAAAQYKAAYERFGEEVNTPAIIADAVNTKLGRLLFCERFLSSAVSLYVTIGLFGTFAGLSLSVSSLSELLSVSSGSEWLSVLDSVGGGLMSALSGMGVAFYTSLAGVACSIILTILRAIMSPETLRGQLETRVELWLDHTVAPTLHTDAATTDTGLVRMMVDGMKESAAGVQQSLAAASAALVGTGKEAARQLNAFDGSIGKFNDGVHDFSEVDYNLRGTVERMDVVIRDLTNTINELNRRLGGGKRT